jgi:hypothetical protein
VFPVRYELNLYMLFRRNSVFKGLTITFSKKIVVMSTAYVAHDSTIYGLMGNGR